MTGKLCFHLKTTHDNGILIWVLAFRNVGDRLSLFGSTRVCYTLVYARHCGDKCCRHSGEQKQTCFLFSRQVQWAGRKGE